MRFLKFMHSSQIKHSLKNVSLAIGVTFIGMNSSKAQLYYNQNCTDCGEQVRKSSRADCIGRACFKKEPHTHDATPSDSAKTPYTVHNSHAFNDLHGRLLSDGQTYEIEFTGQAAKNLYENLSGTPIAEEVTVNYGSSDFLTSERKRKDDKDGRLQRHTLPAFQAKAQAQIKKGEHVTCLEIKKPIMTVPNDYAVITENTIQPKKDEKGETVTTSRYACYIYADKYGYFVGNKLTARQREKLDSAPGTRVDFDSDTARSGLKQHTYKNIVVLKGEEGRKDNKRVDIQDESKKSPVSAERFELYKDKDKAVLFIGDGIATELGRWLKLDKRPNQMQPITKTDSTANNAYNGAIDTRKESLKVSGALELRETTDYMVGDQRASKAFDLRLIIDPKNGKLTLH